MSPVVIGNATLYLGDCLEILPALGKVQAVITDPPYGINTKSDGMGKLNPWNDLCNSAFWYAEWMRVCRKLLPLDNGCLWTCLNWRSLVTFQKAALDALWSIEALMVWDKGWISVGGAKSLRPSYELVALLANEGFAIADRAVADVQKFKWGGVKPNGHPAEKPVDLMKFLIGHSTVEGQTVLDPFMGSGTTGVAALEAGRSFIGIEQNQIWFDLACKRIDQSLRQGRMFA